MHQPRPRVRRLVPAVKPLRASREILPTLVSLLAKGSPRAVLLPLLHQYAIDALGGRSSLLFEHNPRDGRLQPASGIGLGRGETDPWTPAHGEAALVTDIFTRKVPALVTALPERMPELAARVHASVACLAPLAARSGRVGLVVVGLDEAPPSGALRHKATLVVDTFLTALELIRLRRNETLDRELRELLEEFTGSLSANMGLPAGLDVLCQRVNRWLGAEHTAVWVHERRARHLVLRASSGRKSAGRGTVVSAEDPVAPAAVAMRNARAEILRRAGDRPAAQLTVPLRGHRRALGTIVCDGIRVEADGELELLDRADELGRRLSGALENMQLLDDVTRSRRGLENAFDSIAHLVAVSDCRGQIVMVNDAFANRVGQGRDQLLDRPLAAFVGSELAAWLEHQASAVSGADAPVTTRSIVDPVLNGPFDVTMTNLLDRGRERVGTVIVARDLTMQTQLEAEREELRRRLTQSEKLAALGQFVAGVAHELNNPLQGVLGHLELLRVTGAVPKALRRDIQTVSREAGRAATIVRNLLVFTGSRRRARRAISLNGVLQRVMALRASSCRTMGIEVVRHYEPRLPRVSSDPLVLHQVFLNIFMNAQHAVADTGLEGTIEVTTASTPGGVQVTIRDTGAGIPADVLSRIFEPFYTTKEVGQGMGLGMTIAYGIVHEHGGQINAANHPDGGAIFTVELPVPSPSDR